MDPALYQRLTRVYLVAQESGLRPLMPSPTSFKIVKGSDWIVIDLSIDGFLLLFSFSVNPVPGLARPLILAPKDGQVEVYGITPEEAAQREASERSFGLFPRELQVPMTPAERGAIGQTLDKARGLVPPRLFAQGLQAERLLQEVLGRCAPTV